MTAGESLIVGTLCLSVLSITPAPARDDLSAPAGVDAGLAALRQGRFQQAGDRFSLVSRQAPRDAEGPFFEAYLSWWRLLDRTAPQEVRALRQTMEERLAETVKRARARLDDPDPAGRGRAMTILGTALLLDAQSKVARGAHFAAASSARQGYEALSDVLAADADAPDALFAMGVYNYFADKMSVFAKGLRFLLFIPGGDARLGLTQLENAARRSRYFGTESLLILSHIYSGNFEHDFTRSLEFVDRAAARHADSPLIAMLRADLLFRLGRLRESSAAAGEALKMVRSAPGFTEDLEGLAAHRIAACALELHDPLSAIAHVEAHLKLTTAGTPLTKRKMATLLVSAARESGATERALSSLDRIQLQAEELESYRRRLRSLRPDPLAAPRATALQSFAQGGGQTATQAIELLLAANPTDRRLHYDYGRMLQMQGRMNDAQSHLKVAAEGETQTRDADIAGWALLRLGWARDAAGERALALSYYRKASQLKHFTFRAAALDLLNHPALSQPEG